MSAPASPLRVSLAPQRARPASPPALDRDGARVVLGAQVGDFAQSIAPAANTLFGPRGAAVTADGALWICDTGHHRLLGWPALPQHDAAPAALLIGQPGFECEGRNAHGPASAHSLNVPTGICALGEGLAVADAWNHRVLIWHRAPTRANQPADVVLGQPDFAANAINRGRDAPDADSLYWPYGVAFDGTRLWVADTGNRRVLRWDAIPQRSGQPADGVLGQPDFRHRDENAGAVGPAGLRWPHAIARWQGALALADAGNNRVLLWHATAPSGLQPADAILGQPDARSIDHNRGEYWPTAGSLNMPYGIAVQGDRLFVADTANSRVLRFDAPDHADATALAGQHAFADKGDNRWHLPARDSLCWPYALATHGDTAIVVDSGNNRVLLWEIAP